MEREIEFRGKNKKKWVFGHLMYWADNYQIWETHKNGDTHNYLIDKESVGQFTGVTDILGNKVYEGDIVTWQQARGGILPADKSTYVCVVQWCNLMNGWQCKDVDSTSVFTFSSCHLEVIGNIMDNTEMIKSTAI